ncbi:hypothetical protein [Flavobacterium xueshanense]|uniref:Uncharacterized protein n=1 Tax=Flavobacterium xueshanense TaxID=935223 RepID=A0A1I2FL76_9FLAO|nr:hypothetical protein [Flavobacterium xueshanense]SFF05783.1 hypothetical protein SAMN04488131_10811 [Flavobacterium xueshanense]
MEKAAHGNHKLVFTEQHLNENTAHLAQGFDAVSLFTSDVASETVLQKRYTSVLNILRWGLCTQILLMFQGQKLWR